MNFQVTFYCACSKCCGKYGANRPKDSNGNPIVYTASGERAQSGWTIATDWRVLPKGTLVDITFPNGTVHRYKVQDNGVRGYVIDIYCGSHYEALHSGGRLNVKVEVIKE